MKMRAFIAVLTLTLAVLSSHGPSPAEAAGRPDDVSLIVVLERGTDVSTSAARLSARHGGSAPRLFEHVLGGFQFVGPASAADDLARSREVAAVVEDETFTLVDSAGLGFFRIDAEQSINDPNGPYRGAGTRVAIIDSGVDTDHRDLSPNLDLANGYNCVAPGASPEDDNGHGTHVAGIAAAAFNADGYGVVGVAPAASILPLKAFDANGQGSTSWILCALDRLAQVVTAVPVPTVLNMSFADSGSDSACDDGVTSDVLHEALCDTVDAGVTAGAPVVPVAAAGNDDADAAGTIPAAFHDVITVSGLADHDGEPGGAAGWQYISGLFNYELDDTIASFSNWGAAVDVMAPAVDIYSSLPGGHGLLSGTSMAAPHVTGVVAIVLGEHAVLDTEGVRALLAATGECPDASAAGSDGSCAGQGSWLKTSNRSLFDPMATEADPDGIAEPVVNAARAATEADLLGDPPAPPPADAPPSVSIVEPAGGTTVSGTVTITGTMGDDEGVVSVDVYIGDTYLGPASLSTDSWAIAWDTNTAADGGHTIRAVATDTGAQTAEDSRAVTVANTTTTPANTMHVGGLSGNGNGGNKWTATAFVRVDDAAGAPVAGATVTVTAETTTTAATADKPADPGGGNGGGGGGGDGSTGATLSCVTASDGWCSVSIKTSGDAVRFTVTGLAKDGWAHDATADVDSDGATPETDIVVFRP